MQKMLSHEEVSSQYFQAGESKQQNSHGQSPNSQMQNLFKIPAIEVAHKLKHRK